MTHYATCNMDFIEGQCIVGITLMDEQPKHLGPPDHLGIPTWSKLFQTRCGLTRGDGYVEYLENRYDSWCPECLEQAGLPYVLRKK